jgi:hypothetical protein
VYIPVFSVAVMERCCDACRDWVILFPVDCFRFQRVQEFHGASTTVDRKSMRHTMADRSSNEADFLCILLYLAWRLCKSNVTLVITVISTYGRIFQQLRLPVLYWHRPSLTASRWDIRWLIGRRTKPTFCVFSVLNVEVMEKCCDACGYGEYYFRSSFSASLGAGV